jgi:hypothetical protein
LLNVILLSVALTATLLEIILLTVIKLTVAGLNVMAPCQANRIEHIGNVSVLNKVKRSVLKQQTVYKDQLIIQLSNY